MTSLRILVINPNTTQSMTDNLKSLVESLGYENTTYAYFTAASGPASINNDHDAAESALACLAPLELLLSQYDAFLVACYSFHPLVSALRSRLSNYPRKHVIGIFEASITTTLALLPLHPVFSTLTPSCEKRDSRSSFGIVSTGKQWEDILINDVGKVFGVEGGSRWFAGVETMGLNATELHEVPAEQVRKRVVEAAERMVKKAEEVKVVILGCAGMVGMEEWVKEGAGMGVFVVDGVKAGVSTLQSLLRGRY